jgi:hypothetical protein
VVQLTKERSLSYARNRGFYPARVVTCLRATWPVNTCSTTIPCLVSKFKEDGYLKALGKVNNETTIGLQRSQDRPLGVTKWISLIAQADL